ncbi:MAG: putative lipid II flippase FtsW [Candidatus Magasanikbacteria bacterium]
MFSHSPRHHHVDRTFVVYLGILVVFGLVALASASAPLGYEKFNDAYYYVKAQLTHGLLPGIVLFLIAMRITGKFWHRYSGIFYGVALLLLVLVFVEGLSTVINGSHSWLNIAGYTFQPSELAKLAVIIVLSKLLSDPSRDLTDWKNGLMPILAIIAPTLLLIIFQPDIGTLSILVVIVFVMLYLARLSKTYLLVLGLAVIIAFAALMFAAPYRVQRFTTFLHPELDPKGVGYHINQSFLAIGSGGLWGLGLGNSRQKFQYLPEVNADSIFAVMAEEIGFIFSSLFICLILFIGWRGLRIAKSVPDDFSRLMVGGIMTWFLWQSFLNIGAMVGVMPLTGVPLPFISHGGSSVMVMFLAMGIVVGVSRES